MSVLKLSCPSAELDVAVFEPAVRTKLIAVFVSGARPGSHRRSHTFNAWRRRLARDGVLAVVYDDRGIGYSRDWDGRSSLSIRLEDCLRVCNFARGVGGKTVPLALVATSMGAHVACRAAEYTEVSTLLLLTPAAYGAHAENVRFGPEFSAAIRREASWRGSPALRALTRFDGPVFVVYGEWDEVIPSGIQECFLGAGWRSGEGVRLAGVGHWFIRARDTAEEAALYEAIERGSAFLLGRAEATRQNL